MESTKFCSICGSFRQLEDFHVNNHWEVLKTCFRHSNKRKQPSSESWDEFVFEIRDWNRPSQPEKLNVNYAFDMDLLPVAFGLLPKRFEDGSYEKTNLDEAFNHIVVLIWRSCGFRFRKRKVDTKCLSSSYYCAQDKSVFDRIPSCRERDRSTMVRFECHSKLRLQTCFHNRALLVSMEHDYHIPYTDIHLSDEIKNFIEKHCNSQSPSEIYQNIQESRVPGFKIALQSQIYYLWHNISMKHWQRHENQIESAKLLLKENERDYRTLELSVENFRGLAFYINAPILALAAKSKELAVDATYGTNSAGSELFALLAEFDGTGVPLAYLFIEKSFSIRSTKSVVPGKLTQILDQFLRPLLHLGFNPAFFGCGGDGSEINAIHQVWPSAKIQHCFWHAKRVIQIKLKDSSRADSSTSYFPGEAEILVPNIEICWGSYKNNRVGPDHRYGRYQCGSKSIDFESVSRQGISSVEDRNQVMAIFSRHFNAHPMIPDSNGTLRSPETIHRECASEMYAWCRANNYYRQWAYLFVNWYKPKQWELSARSTCPDEIPVLRTTMIVESHWRRIKRDFLYRFNRP